MISFGPVPSRRLEKSLGINNIIAPKVCSYNCVYCQVGRTKVFSKERHVFFDPDVIFNEVTHHLNQLKKENFPDYLTFVSNGEPTLDKNLGTTIQLLKKLGIPIAVITNASLLFMSSVREDLQKADWVSVKIDASDNQTWFKINRPCKGSDFGQHTKFIQGFAKEYKGILCTETMLVKKINDSVPQLQSLAGMVKLLDPEKAYLSVPIRPPADVKVKIPDEEKINEAWQIFNNKQIQTELLINFEGSNTGFTGNAFEDILNITAVHPLRKESVTELLHHDNADYSVINSLLHQQLIKAVLYNNKWYYIRKYCV